MSISLQTMINMSDKNVVDKRLTLISEISGTLKDATSIMNPVIRIQGSLPTNCNYLYIPDFSRYYYVTDVTSIHNDIYEITAHVDVLKTYATQIRGCSGIIARQQAAWNMYIDDGVFSLYQNPQFKIEAFDSGFSTMEFVLAVAGG